MNSIWGEKGEKKTHTPSIYYTGDRVIINADLFTLRYGLEYTLTKTVVFFFKKVKEYLNFFSVSFLFSMEKL